MWGNRRSRRGALAAVLAVALLAACSGSDDGDDDAGSGDGGGDGDEAPAAEGSFTVLTYNVAGLPQEISTENPEEHLPLISPLLDEYDVVLTQEDFDWWRPLLEGFDFVNYHERLRAEATHEHRTTRYPGPEATGVDVGTRTDLQVGDGLGILSRFPFDGEQRVPWEGCFGGFDTSDGGAGDCLAAKGFAVVRMTLADGAELDVYTLHAEAGGTDEDQALQEADYEQLAAFVEEHSEGRAILLGGDTNLHTDPEHPDAEGTADTEIWERFLAATGLTDGCEATGCDRPGAIDKLAFRSAPDGSLELRLTDYEFPEDRFVDADGEPLSDHPPLTATVEWEAR
ncbi:MAG TPA: endonuclease/exonuclease/phosphatase family protein [Acidimicrobiales bacterium]